MMQKSVEDDYLSTLFSSLDSASLDGRIFYLNIRFLVCSVQFVGSIVDFLDEITHVQVMLIDPFRCGLHNAAVHRRGLSGRRR